MTLTRTAEDIGPPTQSEPRLIFLDGARAGAIILMVFAHLTDQLLDPAFHAGALGTLYAATRGFTAPLFFVVSGWSFAVAVLPRVSSGTADFPRRLRRGGVLLFWGYLLTLPWWAPGFPFTQSANVWLPFWTSGVLQTLGVALVIATVLLWWVRAPIVFLALSTALAFAAVVAAPWALAHSTSWPAAVRGYFDPQGVGGGFPLAPWAAYFFAGTALGGTLWKRQATPFQISAALFCLACVAWVAQHWAGGANALFLWRLSCVAFLLGAGALVTRSSVQLPSALRTLGRHGLTFYVVHMVVLWGAPGLPGLAQRFRPELGWLECLGLTLGCLVMTSLGLRLIDNAPAIGFPREKPRVED